jgi:UDP-GlcNAc:undecaprenyl-phosphate/decaprenyl-phosphate GlcNAc-1-phosphate transferase
VKTHGILIGAGVILLVGAADDLLELSPDVKLLGQGLAAAIPVASGVHVDNFTVPFIGYVDLHSRIRPRRSGSSRS